MSATTDPEGNTCVVVLCRVVIVWTCVRSAAAQRSPLSLQEAGQSSVLRQENHEKGLHLILLLFHHLLLILHHLLLQLPPPSPPSPPPQVPLTRSSAFNITFFCLKGQALSSIPPPPSSSLFLLSFFHLLLLLLLLHSTQLLLTRYSSLMFHFFFSYVSRSRHFPPFLLLPPAPPPPSSLSSHSVSAKEPKFSALLAGTKQWHHM